MPVYRTLFKPMGAFNPSIELLRDNLLDALAHFAKVHSAPPKAGYENKMRKFVFKYLHSSVPLLFNLFDGGPHINFGSTYYQADMQLGHLGSPLPNQLSFRSRKNTHILQEIIEWGHDHAMSVPGCVNKPLADFVKWFILLDSSGRYKFNPMPLCFFQIATDFDGSNLSSVSKIQHIFKSLDFITDRWEIDYYHHPAHAYVFMNYFDAGMTFHRLLGSLSNSFYAHDLSMNYISYRMKEAGWPFKLSVDMGVTALDTVLAL